MPLIIGLVFLVFGFFGVRWFYTIFIGVREANSAIETMMAFYFLAMGVIGVVTVFAALRG